jgi:DNA repair protein RecN (Recombination protein N)
MLIDIHSQHAHQSLLRKSHQRDLIDAYAGHQALAEKVSKCASEWLRKKRELELLSGSGEERAARLQLLNYQIEELDSLALKDGELAKLESEQKQLANADNILHSAHEALALCEGQENGARQAHKLLDQDTHTTPAAKDARELLDSAAIQLTEARAEIQAHIDSVQVDPERLTAVQARLESIYDVARKHKIVPERLPQLHADLGEELAALQSGGQRIEDIHAEMASLAEQYQTDAKVLTTQRGKAGKKLVKNTANILKSLAMEQCVLEIGLTATGSEQPQPHGLEDIEFRISTNPGAPTQPLGKIASGGELSRISLSIQVVTAKTATVPSMVFDEVDVGIGGAVAEVVGKLLRDLASNAQVLCVTHLAQVAAQGHQHLRVSKTSSDKSVETTLGQLDDADKINEIARMLGGVKITKQTLAHAKEMLAG